jgi:hypothetical protein
VREESLLKESKRPGDLSPGIGNEGSGQGSPQYDQKGIQVGSQSYLLNLQIKGRKEDHDRKEDRKYKLKNHRNSLLKVFEKVDLHELCQQRFLIW